MRKSTTPATFHVVNRHQRTLCPSQQIRHGSSFLGRNTFDSVSSFESKESRRKTYEKTVSRERLARARDLLSSNSENQTPEDKQSVLSYQRVLDEEFEKSKQARKDPKYFQKLVDQRIREALGDEDWESNPYRGKPLPGTFDTVRHEDPTDRHLKQLMQKHGVLPEWIELNKLIFSGIDDARAELNIAYRQLKGLPLSQRRTTAHNDSYSSSSSSFGASSALSFLDSLLASFLPDIQTPEQIQKQAMAYKFVPIEEREQLWQQKKTEFRERIEYLNKKIQHYNFFGANVPPTCLLGLRRRDECSCSEGRRSSL